MNDGTKYVERRGKSSFRLAIQVGKLPNGERLWERKTVRANTKIEAELLLEEFAREILGAPSLVVEGSCIFKDFAFDWLTNYADKQLAPKTAIGYRGILLRWLIPYFGKLSLKDISPRHIRDYYNYVSTKQTKFARGGKYLSPQTLRHQHRLLHKMMQDACDDEFILRNPVTKKYAPKLNRKNRIQFDQDLAPQLIIAASSEDRVYHLLILLTLTTGMRLGEVLGLQWKHIDFTRKTIEITQASQYLPAQGTIIKSVKNTSSERLISIPTSICKMLQEFHDSFQSIAPTNSVFQFDNGESLKPHLTSYWFSRFVKRHNLEPFRFHDLRHLSATLALKSKVPLSNVSARLGHARTSTTIDIYAHAIREVDYTLSDHFEELLQKQQPLEIPKVTAT